MNTGKPRKICCVPPQLGSTGANSVALAASRQIITRVTSTSSSTQPLNGTAPVTPVRLSTGVSTLPNRCDASAAGMTFSTTTTLTGGLELKRSVTMPAAAPEAGTLMAWSMLMEISPGPVPDDGLTFSHGVSDAVVHDTVPGLV